MAETILSIALTAPSSNVSGAPLDTFTMTVNVTPTGHGGDEIATVHRQMRVNAGSWVDIPTSGAELTTPSNGETWVAATANYSSTVTLQASGIGKTIELRARTSGADSGETLDPASGWLTVTISGAWEASGGATLGAVEAAGTAKVRKKAAGGATLGAVEAAGTAKVRKKAYGAADLATIVASGASTALWPASGAATLGAVEAAGTAKVRKKAAGAATLGAVEAAGTASVAPAGEVAGAYPVRSTLPGVQPGAAPVFVDDGADYYDCGKPPAMQNLNACTIWGWIYLDGDGHRAGRVFSTGDNQLELFINGGAGLDQSQLEFISGRVTTPATSQISVADEVPLNQWAFVAATWAFDEAPRLYIGDLQTPAAEPVTYSVQSAGSGALDNTDGHNALLGNRPQFFDRSFGGRIGAVGIVDHVLTQAELDEIRMRPRAVSGQLGLWFPGIDSQLQTARDWSTTGADGALGGTTITYGEPLPLRVYPERYHRPALTDPAAAATAAYPLARVPWTKQPDYLPAVDARVDLLILPSVGLEECVFGSAMVNSGMQLGMGASGVAAVNDGTLDNRLDADGYRLSGEASHTYVVHFRQKVGATHFRIIGARDTTYYLDGYSLVIGEDGDAQFISATDTTGTRITAQSGAGGYTYGKISTFVVVVKASSPSKATGFIDGVQVFDGAGSGDGSAHNFDATLDTWIFDDARSATGALDGECYLFARIGEAISVAEARELSINPWALFEPRPAPFLIGAVEGAAGKTASGGATLGAVEAAGTAKVRKKAAGAATLGAVEASGTGQTRTTAGGGATLGAVEAAGTAKVHKHAGGAATLGAVEAAGTGQTRTVAGGGATLGAVEAAGTAKVHKKAAGAATLGALEAAGTAKVHKHAGGAATLGAVEAAGTGQTRTVAGGGATLGAVEAAGTAKVRKKAAGAATLGAVEASGITTVGTDNVALGGATLGAVEAAGTAKVRKKAAGAATLGALEAAGTAKVHKHAGGAATLGAVEAAGTGQTRTVAGGGATLGAVEAAGTAKVRKKAAGAATLGAVEASGTTTVGTAPVALGGATLGALEAAGTARVHKKAAGGATLGAIVAAGTADVHITAIGGATLGAIVAAGTARVRKRASGAATLGAIVAAGVARTGLTLGEVFLIARNRYRQLLAVSRKPTMIAKRVRRRLTKRRK